MKILAGLEPPTTGTRDLGTNVGVSYYAQHALEGMTESNTVLQEIDTVTPKWTVPQQRSLLGAFLFSDNDSIEKQVRVLSGGEKARLALAKMLVAPEALLCLDEPTNHLDIDSVDMLENALQNSSTCEGVRPAAATSRAPSTSLSDDANRCEMRPAPKTPQRTSRKSSHESR